jgi:hypothetical protein
MHTVLLIIVLVNIIFIVSRYTLEPSLNESGKIAFFVGHLVFNIFVLIYIFISFLNDIQSQQLQPQQVYNSPIQQPTIETPQQGLPLEQVANLIGQLADNKSKKGSDLIGLITNIAQNNPELVSQVVSAISSV